MEDAENTGDHEDKLRRIREYFESKNINGCIEELVQVIIVCKVQMPVKYHKNHIFVSSVYFVRSKSFSFLYSSVETFLLCVMICNIFFT